MPKLWVERDRYHTAILVQRELVQKLTPELCSVLDEKPFVRFGWGDRDYYGSSEKNLYKLFKALFLPTRSVVEVSTFAQVLDSGTLLVPITAPSLNVEKVMSFISRSFRLQNVEHNKGVPVLLRQEKSGFRYYRGRGIYFAGKNCNNWTAKALRQGDLPVRHVHACFAASVIRQLNGPRIQGRAEDSDRLL